MFKQLIKDYFTFSHAERRGIIFLIAIIIVLLIIPLVYPVFIKRSDTEIKAFRQEIEDWLASSGNNTSDTVSPNQPEGMDNRRLTLFRFNPNNVTPDEISRLDLTKKAKYSWIKFLQKGGKFYCKSDLKKIYGIDSLAYQRLEPYIDLDSIPKKRNLERVIIEHHLVIEINNANQTDFEKLNGIGPALSQRIIKYRNLLGGFTTIDQLTEVFGISDSILNLNRNNLSLDQTPVKMINVNHAGFSSLCRHPYISSYDAKSIIAYRQLKGDLKSFNELIINNLVNDSLSDKLRPYLVFKDE